MIRIEINNNVTKFSGNFKVLRKMYKYFKFKHPNAYFIQNKVKYDWDGFVYPLTKKGSLKTGLLDKALEFLSEEEEEYEWVDHRKVPEILEIPYKVGPLELVGKYAYQRDAIEAIVSHTTLGELHPRGIIAAAVNAGKTPIMMGVHMTYKNAKTIILLNNSTLYDQLRKDLELVFPGSWGYMRGKKIQWGDIMVIMVQTLKNRVDEYATKLSEYNVLLTDEGDLAANKTFEYVYKRLAHIAVRAGFTGTVFLRDLKKDALRNNKIREIFGNVLFEITPIELEEKGVSVKTVVKAVSCPNEAFYDSSTFKSEFDAVITNDPRTHELIWQRIRFNLKSGRRYILVYCKYIAQVEILYKYLEPRMSSHYTMEYTHGKHTSPELIARIKAGEVDIVITSLYLKRGMNFPYTQCIINASGGAFYSNPLQILGRGVRKHRSKDRFFYEDIQFEGKYLSTHSRGRLKFYKKVGYQVRLV